MFKEAFLPQPASTRDLVKDTGHSYWLRSILMPPRRQWLPEIGQILAVQPGPIVATG